MLGGLSLLLGAKIKPADEMLHFGELGGEDRMRLGVVSSQHKGSDDSSYQQQRP